MYEISDRELQILEAAVRELEALDLALRPIGYSFARHVTVENARKTFRALRQEPCLEKREAALAVVKAMYTRVP